MSDEIDGDHELVASEGAPAERASALPWSPTDAITYGWKTLARDPGIILVMAIGYLVMNGLSFMGQAVRIMTMNGGDGARAFGILVFVVLMIANLIVSTYVVMGWITYVLKIVRGQPASLADLFSGGPYLRMLGAYVVFIAVLVPASCALLVPGVIFAIGCGFFAYLIMDQGAPAIESLGASWTLMRGHKWPMFLFMLLATLLSFAGLACCGIGIFVVIPITSIGHGWIYMRITGQETVAIE